ncbi:MAG: hypothetical protein ABFD81_02765 [Syntrophaceae bacterium]
MLDFTPCRYLPLSVLAAVRHAAAKFLGIGPGSQPDPQDGHNQYITSVFAPASAHRPIPVS